MKRRDALKTLMMASGSMLVLPSWAIGWKADDMARMNTTFTDYQIKIITSLVDMIIPSNGEIGGLSVGVDQYLIGLISRCFEEEFQGNFKANLGQLDDHAQEKYGKQFSDCDRKTQENLFKSMKTNEDENDEDFFNFMKSQTIKGFETSEEVMVNYHGFVLMPGFYDGNVDVEA
tara:strand:+ start:26149 stop:26670 length:522 start_codon:yes stop_codon:yes gene_type:complete